MIAPTVAEVHDVISAANETFMAAFNRGDAAGLAALYTENGQALPPNSDFVTGRQAIQTFWQALFDRGIQAANLEIGEVERCGETIFEVSQYTLKTAEGQVVDQGKYVVIWKQENGQWKLHRDIFNSSIPTPGS